MKFTEFQDTGTDCEDLGAALSDELLSRCPGRTYLGQLWIHRLADGRWRLQIHRSEWIEENLLNQEVRLYQFALDEDYAQD